MQAVSGIAEIIEHFERVASNVTRDAAQIPKKISDSWVLMINLTDAIDSGDMLRAVNFHPVAAAGDLQQFVIDTSDNAGVDYEGFVEGGTKLMLARFPAERGIEREDFVSSISGMIEDGLR